MRIDSESLEGGLDFFPAARRCPITVAWHVRNGDVQPYRVRAIKTPPIFFCASSCNCSLQDPVFYGQLATALTAALDAAQVSARHVLVSEMPVASVCDVLAARRRHGPNTRLGSLRRTGACRTTSKFPPTGWEFLLDLPGVAFEAARLGNQNSSVEADFAAMASADILVHGGSSFSAVAAMVADDLQVRMLAGRAINRCFACSRPLDLARQCTDPTHAAPERSDDAE